MKKILVFAAILALIACPLLAAAAPAVKAAAPAAGTQITTITKEVSQSNYPGVLVPGSMTGVNAFMSDLNLIGNTVLFEFVGTSIGLVVLKTDLGTIAMSVAPGGISDVFDNCELWSFVDDEWGSYSINNQPNMPEDILGLMYANKIGSMPVGFGILYGLEKSDYADSPGKAYNTYTENQYNQYLSLKAGAGLGEIDLGAAFSLLNDCRKYSYYNNYGMDWGNDETFDIGQWQADINARWNLGDGLRAVVGLTYASGKNEFTYADNNPENDGFRWTNSTLVLNAVVGKDIKAGETLVIKIAGGLEAGGDTNGKYEYFNKLAPEDNWNGTYGWGDRTLYGYWDVPLHVAVEAKLNETWTLNAGTSATIVGFNNTKNRFNIAEIGDEKIHDMFENSALMITPSLNYDLGVSGKIGDLNLDLFLNPMILISGPHFITGNSYGSMAGSVALHYGW